MHLGDYVASVYFCQLYEGSSLMEDVDNEENLCMSGGSAGGEILLSLQFCCQPETALKK